MLVFEERRADDARDLAPALLEDLVGAVRDPSGRVRVGRSAVRRVVLEAAVARGIVRGGDDDTVGETRAGGSQRLRGSICAEDRHGHGGGRGVRGVRVDLHTHSRSSKNLEGGAPGGLGQCVGVTADEERAINALARSVFDDRCGDRDDVCFVELAVERGSAVSGSSEGHTLVDNARVGFDVVIGGQDLFDVDEVFGKGKCASSLMHAHSVSLWVRSRKGFSKSGIALVGQ